MNKNNMYVPLKEVILQVCFPTLLAIDVGEPVDFQNKIYSRFPNYDSNDSTISELFVNPYSSPLQKNKTIKNFIFISKDGQTRVVLNNNSLTITTLNYKSWDSFSNICFDVINQYCEVYKPAFFNRLGLRYINVITKSEYNLDSFSWKDIINSEYLANLINIDESFYRSFNIFSELYDSNNNIITKENYGLVRVDNNTDNSFMADADYIYLNDVDTNSINKIFEKLHDKSSNYLSRVCKKKLLDSIGDDNDAICK